MEDLQEVFDGLGANSFRVNRKKLMDGIPLLDFLTAETTIFSSKSEAKKMLAAQGVSLNKEKISDPASSVSIDHLLAGKFIVFQKGKKNFYLVGVE